MSLFGDEDSDFAASRSQKKTNALFDESSAAQSTNSLFDDDATVGNDAGWGFTPKKAGRGDQVKSLLANAAVPDSYVDAYDALLATGQASGGGVSVDGVKVVLSEAGLDDGKKTQILRVVGDHKTSLGRNEFFVAMALIGLAQEDDELSLDAVDERRRKLPHPDIGTFLAAKKSPNGRAKTPPRAPDTTAAPVIDAQATPKSSPAKPRDTARRTSFGLDADPWGSPELHKNHNHGGARVNGSSSSGTSTLPARTTSNFTTAASDAAGGADASGTSESGVDDITAWGGANTAPTQQFRHPGLGGEGGFGSVPGGDGGDPGRPRIQPSMTSSRAVTSAAEETIKVTIISEKEGMFGFQHRNYEVASARRNSKVVRRYSDFVWLLDCLHKRYPFRQLPLLPPKRVAINGNHIAADLTFIEKRRKGLARFANALVRHPILSQEQLVIMFLTVPTELAVWRKQATISVQEEFVGKTLPPDLEDSLSPDLQNMFDTVRSGVKRSSELYINLCNTVERLAKRTEGMAAECGRTSMLLQSLTETSSDTYAADTNDVPLLNDGILATAKHLTQSQALLDDEAKAWDDGVMEDLKRQRDCLVSLRDMFDRRDRYDRDNIPQLEKRIESNERKLANIRAKPEGTLKPGEAEKVEDAILKDKQSIVAQHARSVFVKECIRDEIDFFQGSQYHVSRLHQDWSQERVKYAELQADNWRALSEAVEGMPLGD